METLSVYQVASLRIASAGLVLLPLTIRHIRSIPYNKMGFVFLSGLLGSLLPSFLFCVAETKIDSALAGMLNALTPIVAIVSGIVIFGLKVSSKKLTGILIAAATLGIFGTAIANILFYMLIKRAGVLFSSMVTYGIPFVAICWGVIAREDIGRKQIFSLVVILTGVYFANRTGKVIAVAD